MPKLLLLLLALLAFAPYLSAQKLLVDRGPESGPVMSLALPKNTPGFLADNFKAGQVKEDWVIDHIRMWTVPDPKATAPNGLGSLFKKVSLIGGIAPDPTAPDQKASAECDCHNLPSLLAAAISPDGDSTDNPDLKISSIQLPDGSPAWQLDFENLNWSLPGGTAIQFGVLAEPYSGYTWYNVATASAPSPNLRVFSSAGKMQSTFQPASPGSIDVQVWGHLLARVSIHSSGQRLKVVLRSLPYLAAEQVDRASLRFGPRSVSPDQVRVEDVNHTGKVDVVMYFSVADSGLPANSINACVNGRRSDGAPFEGCDLLPH